MRARDIGVDELLSLDAYERVRDEARKSAIAARALRRVAVGPNATLAFESRETVRYQVQEIVRAERIVAPEAIAHELETYNEMLPGPSELSATLMLEFTDVAEREARLAELVGLERHVRLVVAPFAAVAAVFDPRQYDGRRVSAVQFVRFPLPPETRRELGRAGAAVRVVFDHPRYEHVATVDAATVSALAADLSEASGSEAAP